MAASSGEAQLFCLQAAHAQLQEDLDLKALTARMQADDLPISLIVGSPPGADVPALSGCAPAAPALPHPPGGAPAARKCQAAQPWVAMGEGVPVEQLVPVECVGEHDGLCKRQQMQSTGDRHHRASTAQVRRWKSRPSQPAQGKHRLRMLTSWCRRPSASLRAVIAWTSRAALFCSSCCRAALLRALS